MATFKDYLRQFVWLLLACVSSVVMSNSPQVSNTPPHPYQTIPLGGGVWERRRLTTSGAIYVCMYVCMYACMYVCMYVCMCIYIHMFSYIHSYIHTYIHTYMHMLYAYVGIHVCGDLICTICTIYASCIINGLSSHPDHVPTLIYTRIYMCTCMYELDLCLNLYVCVYIYI